ncbi:MAG: hypothetical protein ACKVOK_10190 [Flavobacteriales bacterium]
MSTNRKYYNQFGKPITEEQKNELTSYKEDIFVNEDLRKRIEYYNNSIKSIHFYLFASETVISVLPELSSPEYQNAFVKIIEKSTIGSYSCTIFTLFEPGLVNSNLTEKKLYDSTGKLLCDQLVDSISNAIIETFKYFYPEGSNYGIECQYHEGQLDTVENYSPINPKLNVSEYLTIYPNFLVDNPYYGTDSFLPLLA